MGTDGLNGCLDNFGTLLFGAGRGYFGRTGRNFTQKSGRERLCFLSLRIISGHAFIHVDVAIRAGFAANADMRFSSESPIITSNNVLIFYYTYTIESKKKSVYFTDFSLKTSFSLEYRERFERLLGFLWLYLKDLKMDLCVRKILTLRTVSSNILKEKLSQED